MRAVLFRRTQQILPLFGLSVRHRITAEAVRKIDQKLNVTNATFVKVPFDLAHWQKVAAEKYPHGLPKPFSSDPTQWLFNGHPKGSDQPLHVAVARLLGYQWPRQTGSSFPDCPALGPDGLEKLADEDGIVCLSATKGEAPAAERLRGFLVQALGKFDLSALIASAGPKGSKAETLEEWLRDEFFEQHCALFHHRPFIWHIWDGHKSGFSALVNYHQAHPRQSGKAHLCLPRRLDSPPAGRRGRRRGRQRRPPPGRQAIAGPPQAHPRRRAALRPLRPLEAALQASHRLAPRHQRRRADEHPPLSRTADILRKRVKIKWEKDRGKEPVRDKKDFPWFWGWDEEKQDFAGVGKEPDGNRWNDCHYTNEFKKKAREANKPR